MSEKQTQSSVGTVESAALTGLPVTTTAAAVEALHSYGHINAEWIESVPGHDHLSSIAGSYAIGAVGGAITERIATRLDTKGREKSAERVRKIGNAATFMGSLACQLAVEASMRGVNDEWDVIAGSIATVPGLIAGRGFSKNSNEHPEDIKSTD